MSLYLESKEGVWELSDGDFVIGRVSDCDIVIKDPRISRNHAVIHVSGRMVTVEDLGSANGVLVNGDRIGEPTVLMPNDSLVAGPVLFRLRMAQGDSRASTTAEMNRHRAENVGASSEFLPQPDYGVTNRSSDGIPGTDFPIEPSTNEPHRAPTSLINASSKAALTHRRSKASATRIPEMELAEVDPLTDEHFPSEHRKIETAALQRRDWFENHDDPHKVTESDILAAETKSAGRWRRLAAAALDGATLLLVSGLVPLMILIAGMLVAQDSAGDTGSLGRNWSERLVDLLSGDGFKLAMDSIRLWHAESPGAFGIFFGSASLAVLMAVLGVIFLQIIPSILNGAPFWHRRLRIEVIDEDLLSYLGVGKACARTALLLVLAPVALVCVLMDKRSPHDRICKSRLMYR